MADSLRYPHIIAAIRDTPWAILPSKMTEILEFMAFKAAGGDLSAEEVRARLGAASERQRAQPQAGVAVMPMLGTIAHRADLLTESSGGTSVQGMTRQFRALLADPSVSAIVLDVDSPGGAVSGIEEFASEIYKARGIKPVTAVANTLMASAAYWLASSAAEVVATPSALVGSIGVIGAHEDQSAMYDKLGVKVSLISAGKYKAENNPFEPLTEEGRAELQKRVDDSYGRFTRAVARNRGVPVDTVRGGFGEGRVVSAQEAVRLGMVDRVATLDDVIANLSKPRETSAAPAQAALGAEPTYAEFLDLVAGQLQRAIEWTEDRRDFRAVEGRGVGERNWERLAELASQLQGLLAQRDVPTARAVSAVDLARWQLRARDIDLLLADAG